MLLEKDRIEYVTAADPLLDFCLWEYESSVSAVEKYRSINLLYRSFECAAVSSSVYEFCDELRAVLGDWKTVWGVKLVDGKLSWEFYFYYYKRMDREVSINRVLAIVAKYTEVRINPSEDNLYFMFSLDIDDELCSGAKPLEQINIYLGDISEQVSAGICYLYTREGLRLDNLYHFFDRASCLPLIRDKIYASLHLSLQDFELDSVLIPELSECRTIVVANKKFSDGIYYSGMGVERLLSFMNLMNYPEDLVNSVSANHDRLDHMLFDVGIDYRMRGREIDYLKSSFYGVF